MGDYYDDDEGHYHVRRHRPVSPVRYVNPQPTFIVPERRSRSRERFREMPRSNRSSVVINNVVKDDDDDYDDDYDDGRMELVPHRRRSRSMLRTALVSREDLELDALLTELRELRLNKKKLEEAEEAKKQKDLEDYRLKQRESAAAQEDKRKKALDELQRIKKQQEADEEEKKRKDAEELKQRRLDEKKRREAEDEKERKKVADLRRQVEEAEKAKAKKADEQRILDEHNHKLAREKEQREQNEREVKRQFERHLVETGLSEAQIAAIMKKKNPMASAPVSDVIEVGASRPTYTRMARRHVSLETLRAHRLEFDLDPADSEYILVKRWVPEDEQVVLWRHTKRLRTERVVVVDSKRHRRTEPEFEWVRKRRRSKSPSLLMYLAGASR